MTEEGDDIDSSVAKAGSYRGYLYKETVSPVLTLRDYMDAYQLREHYNPCIIRTYITALSELIGEDVSELPKWKEVDRVYGELPYSGSEDIKPKHWYARRRALLDIETEKKVIGGKKEDAPGNGPGYDNMIHVLGGTTLGEEFRGGP